MVTISIPALHDDQQRILDNASRLNAVCCGRRYGKTDMMVSMGADAALGLAEGGKVGLFTPEHKQLSEPWDALVEILDPIARRVNASKGEIRLLNGGLIDFWSLNDNQLAGRGREYDLLMVDEAAFTKNAQMPEVWRKSIAPTMVTRPGARAFVFSTPNGVDPDNFFWKICHEPELRFKVHHAPSSANPYIMRSELKREQQQNHPMIWRQEFLAEFVDWSGSALIGEQDLLVDGLPVQYPTLCNYVFAVIDSAVKSGFEHDGTAVTYFAYNPFAPEGKHKLTILDWDVVSIDGAFLDQWLPSVFGRLDELKLQCKCRLGSVGAFIEDAASGIILLQIGTSRGWPVHPIDNKLTSAGKDGRVLAILNYTHQGLVKISTHAYAKQVMYKGVSRNHLMQQVTGFRIGDKDNKRADDLLDTFAYGVWIGLGSGQEYSK